MKITAAMFQMAVLPEWEVQSLEDCYLDSPDFFQELRTSVLLAYDEELDF